MDQNRGTQDDRNAAGVDAMDQIMPTGSKLHKCVTFVSVIQAFFTGKRRDNLQSYQLELPQAAGGY